MIGQPLNIPVQPAPCLLDTMLARHEYTIGESFEVDLVTRPSHVQAEEHHDRNAERPRQEKRANGKRRGRAVRVRTIPA